MRWSARSRSSCWRAEAAAPYASTYVLGDVALARAVGAANGANPIPIVIPCRRVVGADGFLVGGALDLERRLHELESDVVAGRQRGFDFG